MMLEEEYRERQSSENQQYLDMFVERLDIDQDLAEAMVEMGFTSLEEVAYVPAETFEEIGLDEETVGVLQERAKEATLADVLRQQQNMQHATEELLAMEGMTPEVAQALAQKGICTVDDLADQAIDDIIDIEVLDEEKAGQLIMKARESWFN